MRHGQAIKGPPFDTRATTFAFAPRDRRQYRHNSISTEFIVRPLRVCCVRTSFRSRGSQWVRKRPVADDQSRRYVCHLSRAALSPFPPSKLVMRIRTKRAARPKCEAGLLSLIDMHQHTYMTNQQPTGPTEEEEEPAQSSKRGQGEAGRQAGGQVGTGAGDAMPCRWRPLLLLLLLLPLVLALLHLLPACHAFVTPAPASASAGGRQRRGRGGRPLPATVDAARAAPVVVDAALPPAASPAVAGMSRSKGKGDGRWAAGGSSSLSNSEVTARLMHPRATAAEVYIRGALGYLNKVVDGGWRLRTSSPPKHKHKPIYTKKHT